MRSSFDTGKHCDRAPMPGSGPPAQAASRPTAARTAMEGLMMSPDDASWCPVAKFGTGAMCRASEPPHQRHLGVAAPGSQPGLDRKSVVLGKRVPVRVDLGGSRNIK